MSLHRGPAREWTQLPTSIHVSRQPRDVWTENPLVQDPLSGRFLVMVPQYGSRGEYGAHDHAEGLSVVLCEPGGSPSLPPLQPDGGRLHGWDTPQLLEKPGHCRLPPGWDTVAMTEGKELCLCTRGWEPGEVFTLSSGPTASKTRVRMPAQTGKPGRVLPTRHPSPGRLRVCLKGWQARRSLQVVTLSSLLLTVPRKMCGF